jgi:general secretion pathway protein D
VSLKRAIACLVLLCVGGFFTGCSNPLTRQSLLDSKIENTGSATPSASAKRRKLDQLLTSSTNQPDDGFQGYTKQGNDQFFQSIGNDNEAEPLDDSSKSVTLNLVDASIPQAAKSVFGDVLGLNYTVDPRVQGAITLQTSKPISKAQLASLFETALRDNGAAIISNGSNYRIVPMADAKQNMAISNSDPATPGIHPQIIPLRYVSAAEMQTVLEPMVPPGMIIRADQNRNAIILAGSSKEIATLRETISVFDVDWMKGMSFALVPVRSSSPAAIVQDLDQVFQTQKGPLRGVVRFVPNQRLKSVLVISSRSKYLNEATRWIKKLDVLSENTEEGLHVYHVQNRSAAELAKVLTAVLENGASPAQAIAQASGGTIAPKYAPSTLTDNGVADATGAITGGPETPANGVDAIPQPLEMQAVPEDEPIPQKRTRVVADDANNSLLIFSTMVEFERVKQVLEEIDAVPNQVLLEAVIAEVSLDDDLKFGVRWFLGEGNNHGTFSDAVSGAVSSVFPGFSYFLKSNDISFTLNAISSVTNVRVLSAPSLVVLDNKTAVLQVGDQVPIVTQSAKAVSAGDAPIVTNVELKDTGVILKVTPRVNDSGLVTLDIEQEVSSVVKTTTSGIDSPTIRQRKMKTSVVVQDSEALALGGLIQERETTGKSKVPVLGDIPILGAAFRNKSDAVARTELIIFIRPRVIRDLNEAKKVTAEFRKQLSIQAPRVRREDPLPGDELLRIFK